MATASCIKPVLPMRLYMVMVVLLTLVFLPMLVQGCILFSDTELDEPGSAESPTDTEWGACVVAMGDGDTCDKDSNCADPLRCIEFQCRLESIEGEPCDTNSDCVNDLFCEEHDVQGRELPNPVCRQEIPLDGACHNLNSSSCAGSGNDCIRQTCQPESEEGGPCESNTDCDGDTYCNLSELADDSISGRCWRELGDGNACSESNDGCGTGLYCLNGICEPRGGTGASCESFGDCQTDHYCDRYEDDGSERSQDVCLAENALGANCDPGEFSNCDSSNCVDGTCVDDQPYGAVCEYDSDCSEGLRCAISD